MSFRPARGIFLVLISAGLQCAQAQQTVSPIEQARLFKELPTSTNMEVDANGTALADDDTTSEDSFGEQLILKSQPRVGSFTVTGGASVFYTNNVALTGHDTVDDAFFVANVGVSWTSWSLLISKRRLPHTARSFATILPRRWTSRISASAPAFSGAQITSQGSSSLGITLSPS